MLVKVTKSDIAEIVGMYLPKPKKNTSRMTRRKAIMKSLDAAVAVCSTNGAAAAETKGTIAYVANSVSSGLKAESKSKKPKKTISFSSYLKDKVSSSYRSLQKKTRIANYYSLADKMRQKEDTDVAKEAKLKMQRFYLAQNPAYFIG